MRDLELTENYADAVRVRQSPGMTDMMIDAAQNPRRHGRAEKPRDASVRYGQPADDLRCGARSVPQRRWFHGNKAAQAGARAWLDTIEKLRQRFNSGGNVGKLGYGYLSRAHDRGRVLAAGPDAWAKVLPLLDRSSTSTPMGPRWTTLQCWTCCAAHATIAENGTNKTRPGQFTGSQSAPTVAQIIGSCTSATARRGWTI